MGMNNTEPKLIFDQARVRQSKARANAMDDDFDFLRAEIADRLLERLGEINRNFSDAFDFGKTQEIENLYPNLKVSRSNNPPSETLDTEAGQFDLAISNLMLHWVNDLPGMLIQLNRSLKPDGLFVASMFGGDTLHELRHAFIHAEAEIVGGASPRVSPFADVRDIGSLLQRAGFALPVTDMDTITVNYDHPLKLMHDLRGMGETNSLIDRSRKSLRRDVLMRTCEIYVAEFASADGRIPATFQILYMTGWHPHESQQKPLKPGSGKVSLKDALGKK
jgi:SAM-dependent methyltransferase